MKITTKGVTVRSGGVKYPPGSTIDIDDEAGTRIIARGCATEAPVEPDGTMSPEITGDGASEPLTEAPPEVVVDPEPTPDPEPIAPPMATKPKRGKA